MTVSVLEEVRVEAANVPMDVRRQHLAEAAAHRLVDDCAIVPSELKQPMHQFAASAFEYIVDVAVKDRRSSREDVHPGLEAREILETSAGSDTDRMAQIILAQLSRSRGNFQDTVEGERRKQPFTQSLRSFPLYMRVSQQNVHVEVARFESSDRPEQISYVIHDLGTIPTTYKD